MIFQHYRELVKPKDAARYFQIGPAKAAKKIVPMVAARLPEQRFRFCSKGEVVRKGDWPVGCMCGAVIVFGFLSVEFI
jgi:hypothetical protein